ncbi:MAG TPA: M48 family metallopeptidase [Burkholderiales bacterium]|nr:M48 family metallopeptidase [Burkholderiales bacterium]
MTPVRARYYDGKTSDHREVLVYPDPPGRLRVVGEGVDFSRRLADVRTSPRVGNSRRHLNFPDGSQCETDDNDGIDRILAGLKSEAPGRLLHLLESRTGYVIAALALTAGALWAGIVYGIPSVAKQVAFSLPVSTDKAIGRNALEGLDHMLLKPSTLPPARQKRVRDLFSKMISGIEGAGDYRIELRASSGLGANALALPSGVVVVTDGLVELSKSDDELAAVFAHEIGHLQHRHSLRRLLQDSATVVIVAAVTGDLSSVASLGAVPVVILEARYSRDFEREADDFALEYMQAHGRPPEAFAAILLRMQQGRSDGIPYLSTHPATHERVERFRAAR